jgi:hypothetical protein
LCNLQLYLESSQTDYELMTVILEAISAWLTGDIIASTDYPPRCRRAINAQTTIGWHEFLPGYWAKEWSILQDAHLRKTSQWTHKCNGQTWATHTITTLWEYVHKAWTLHNDTVHAHDANTEDTDLQTRTQFRIIRLNQRRDKTMAVHRDYFFETPMTTLNATTLNFQRNWLNLYEPAILESIKMAQAKSIKDTPSPSILHHLCWYLHHPPKHYPPNEPHHPPKLHYSTHRSTTRIFRTYRQHFGSPAQRSRAQCAAQPRQVVPLRAPTSRATIDGKACP